MCSGDKFASVSGRGAEADVQHKGHQRQNNYHLNKWVALPDRRLTFLKIWGSIRSYWQIRGGVFVCEVNAKN